MSSFAEVCAAGDLELGVPLGVEIDGDPVCVVKVDEGVFAFDDVCPHRGAKLSEGRLKGTTLECAAHTWEFDVTSGALQRIRAPACLAMREVRETDGGAIEVSTASSGGRKMAGAGGGGAARAAAGSGADRGARS